MASPGMMQSGLSRQLFEAWCTDKRNGVVIAGYCVEGTLAKVRSLRERGREGGKGRGREGGWRERERDESVQVLIFMYAPLKFLHTVIFVFYFNNYPACDD